MQLGERERERERNLPLASKPTILLYGYCRSPWLCPTLTKQLLSSLHPVSINWLATRLCFNLFFWFRKTYICNTYIILVKFKIKQIRLNSLVYSFVIVETEVESKDLRIWKNVPYSIYTHLCYIIFGKITWWKWMVWCLIDLNFVDSCVNCYPSLGNQHILVREDFQNYGNSNVLEVNMVKIWMIEGRQYQMATLFLVKTGRHIKPLYVSDKGAINVKY